MIDSSNRFEVCIIKLGQRLHSLDTHLISHSVCFTLLSVNILRKRLLS